MSTEGTQAEIMRHTSRRRFLAFAGAASAIAASDAVKSSPASAAPASPHPRDAGEIWATDYGTIGTGGDDTAVLTNWLQSAPLPGQTSRPPVSSLYLPAGTYRVSKTLVQYQSDVVLDPQAVIQATDDFGGGPIWRTNDGLSPLVRASLHGGIFDCRGLAQGVLLSYFAHFSLSGLVIRDYKDFGVQAGAETYRVGGGTVPNSYELIMSDVVIHRTLPATWDPASLGLYLRKSSDNEIDNVIVHGAGVGVRVNASATASNLSDIHVWGNGATKPGVTPGYPAQLPSVCFLDEAQGTSYVQCTADSPSRRGFDLEADATRMTACRVFANSYVPPSTVDAIYIQQPGARVSVVNCMIIAMAGHEFSRDIGAPDGAPDPTVSGSNTFVGNVCTSAPLAAGAPNGAIQRRLNVRMASDSVKFGWLQTAGVAMYSSDFGTQTAAISANGAVTPGTPSGLGASFYSGSGSPIGSLAGHTGDLYVDKAGAKGSWLYRCSGGKSWAPMA